MGEAIYAGWYDIAGLVNKFCVWVTIGLGVLAWLVYSAFIPLFLAWNIWILIFPVVGAILYLIFVQKKVTDKDLGKMTHIWLLISMVVACIGYFWAAALLILQFVMVSILSDTPIWEAFSEKSS
jgi:glucan phosphoethanolaminetransferase (alkaline phosphatase superfamily)